jgi:3-oxoacyl-[acyl-carrier-protein] synthase III
MQDADLAVSGKRYGVASRLIARPNTSVVDLATAACRKLLSCATIHHSDLGALILSSRIEDPTTAAQESVQRLGLGCDGLGIERACSGFPAATALAIEQTRARERPVAIITAEKISPNINWEAATQQLSDHQRARGQAASLFADGAAGVLVLPEEKDANLTILDAWQGEVDDQDQLIQKTRVEQAIDPWGNPRPGATECMSMPGRRGFLLAKRAPQIMAQSMSKSLSRVQAEHPLDRSTITHLVPHQASGIILAGLVRHLRHQDHVPHIWKCLEHVGNTVSASIPTAMAMVQEHLPPGAVVAMPSVGAGGPGYRPDALSTGCVLSRVPGVV